MKAAGLPMEPVVFVVFFVAIYCSDYVIAVAHNSRNGYHTGCCDRVIQDEIDSDGQRPE